YFTSTAPPEIYPLSLHDALPILLVKLFGRKRLETKRFDERAARVRDIGVKRAVMERQFWGVVGLVWAIGTALAYWGGGHLVLSRSEEHTSELQSRENLVCRLLLE